MRGRHRFPGADKLDGLFAVAVDSGEKRPLTDPGCGAVDRDSAVAPDGRSSVFERNTTPFSGRLYRLPVVAGFVPAGPTSAADIVDQRRETELDARQPRYSARDAWRTLGSSTHSTGVRPRGRRSSGRTDTIPSSDPLADGRLRLVYVRHFGEGNIWRVDAAQSSRCNWSDAGEGHRVHPGPTTSPVSLPDGRRYRLPARIGPAERTVGIADPDGSNAVQLTTMAFASGPGFPRWSPHSKSRGSQRRPGRATRTSSSWRPPGGSPKILTESMPNGGFPSFSAYGRLGTSVRSREPQVPRIGKMPVSGVTAVQVTKEVGTLGIEASDGYLDRRVLPPNIYQSALAGSRRRRHSWRRRSSTA